MNIQRVAVTLTAVNLALLLTALVQNPSQEAQTISPVLRARALEVVDHRGTVRARLNVESDGEVVFRLLDETATIRVKLGASKDGSGLLLANDATEPGVHLLAGPNGTRLRLANKDGRERVLRP